MYNDHSHYYREIGDCIASSECESGPTFAMCGICCAMFIAMILAPGN